MGYVFAQKRLWRVLARKSAFAGTQNGTQRPDGAARRIPFCLLTPRRPRYDFRPVLCESRCKLLANSLRLWLLGYMLTREFVAWLAARRAAGESLAVIGSSMGVSHEAVRKWLAGGEPSQMALMLAAILSHQPRELPPGL